MTEKQQQIINMISAEISQALILCEHHRNESGDDADKIDAYIASYAKEAVRLRSIRESLEKEFTIIHYDPR